MEVNAAVIGNRAVASGVFRMELNTGTAMAREAHPGRFLQIRVSEDVFPVLRRPLTVSSRTENTLTVIYETAGRGTGILAERKPGETVGILGPLGTGYRLMKGPWLLIGGGMGAAGFPCLAREVECREVLLGASSARRLLKVSGISCRCITDDGSSGRRGLVTRLLEDVRLSDFENVALCGPVAMMKAVAAMLPPDLLPRVQVSTEARMGCGWGACEGCAIPAAGGGYIKCCTDGPVIPADKIDWQRWNGV